MAGLFPANGYEAGDVMEPAIASGDPFLGLSGAWAVTVALFNRQVTGETARIDVAMAEAMAATVGELWMEYAMTGKDPVPHGNHDARWAPHDCYRAAGEDRWVTIACTSDQSWQALASVVDPVLAQDPRFLTAADRKRNEAALDEIISAWTAERDRWDVCRSLQGVGVASFPSLSPLDLWCAPDPQLESLGMLQKMTHPAAGEWIVPGIPWRVANSPNGLRHTAPVFGQHTYEVCREVLDLDEGRIKDLVERGVLRGPA
jgi:benzylsuccinate CoA-transferase BbsF subunit